VILANAFLVVVTASHPHQLLGLIRRLSTNHAACPTP